MKKLLFIIIILSLMTAVLTGLAIVLKGWPGSKKAVDYRTPTITSKLPEQKNGRILITTEIIPPTAEGTPTYVKLTIKPAGEEITLAAFDLKLWIKTAKGNVKTGGAIAMDKDLAKLDWTFPIKRVKTEGEQLVAEISGLHIAQKAFELPDEQILAMIPIIIPTGEKITVEFDNQVTQFLDSKSLKLITAHEQK